MTCCAALCCAALPWPFLLHDGQELPATPFTVLPLQAAYRPGVNLGKAACVALRELAPGVPPSPPAPVPAPPRWVAEQSAAYTACRTMPPCCSKI